MGNILSFLDWLGCHISIILTLGGFLFAWYTYPKNLRYRRIQRLTKQVIAFYSLEQEAIKEIQKYSSQRSIKEIKMTLCNAAQSNSETLENEYPSMTAKGARSLMNL